MEIFARLQSIDRRILYLLLFVVVSLPLLLPMPVPAAAVLPQTQGFYDTLEAMSRDPARRDKLVILSVNFSASTAAENLTQTESVVRHLMKQNLKFAIFDFNDPQGRELGQQVAEKLQGQYGYSYGRNWVNWGFRPPGAAVNTIKAMVRDIPSAIGTDYRGTKIADIPVMQGVKGVDDIGAIIEIASANTVPVWFQYYQRTGKQPIPTLFACTAVMAPEAYPFLKSGQLNGMLVGLKGAIEYEGLLKESGFATRASASLSYAHFLIVALIVLGNVGMFAARKRTAGGAA